MTDKPRTKKINRWLELDYVSMEITKKGARVWFEDGTDKEYFHTRGYRLSRAASYCIIPVAFVLFCLIEYIRHT